MDVGLAVDSGEVEARVIVESAESVAGTTTVGVNHDEDIAIEPLFLDEAEKTDCGIIRKGIGPGHEKGLEGLGYSLNCPNLRVLADEIQSQNCRASS